jgi:hypothetical protein
VPALRSILVNALDERLDAGEDARVLAEELVGNGLHLECLIVLVSNFQWKEVFRVFSLLCCDRVEVQHGYAFGGGAMLLFGTNGDATVEPAPSLVTRIADVHEVPPDAAGIGEHEESTVVTFGMKFLQHAPLRLEGEPVGVEAAVDHLEPSIRSRSQDHRVFRQHTRYGLRPPPSREWSVFPIVVELRPEQSPQWVKPLKTSQEP